MFAMSFIFKNTLRVFNDYIANAPFSWLLLCAGAYVIAPLATAVIEQVNFFTTEPVAARFLNHSPLFNNLFLLGHIIFAIPALLIGPWMLHKTFRKRHLNWHRELGKIYVICCLASSASGFCLALANPHGWLAKAGFATLATIWFVSTYKAYYAARNKDIKAHRRWMLRSYALTYAFLMVKALGFLMPYAQMELSHAIALRSWLCWVPNFLFAEIYIRLTTHKGNFVGWKKQKSPA